MIGKIFVFKTGKIWINGTIKTYTVGDNQDIKKGQFVKLQSNKVEKITSSSDTILGVAIKSRTQGQSIEVVVPK